MTPAGTSNELDVQNGWEENTHTYHRGARLKSHVHSIVIFLLFQQPMFLAKVLIPGTNPPGDTDARKLDRALQAYSIQSSTSLFLTFSVLVANPKKLYSSIIQ